VGPPKKKKKKQCFKGVPLAAKKTLVGPATHEGGGEGCLQKKRSQNKTVRETGLNLGLDCKKKKRKKKLRTKELRQRRNNNGSGLAGQGRPVSQLTSRVEDQKGGEDSAGS